MRRIFGFALAFLMMMPGQVPAQPVEGAVQLVNSIRAQAGLSELRIHPKLQAAAEYHARDMATRNYRGHKSPEGNNHGDRALAHGYEYCYLSENIGQGQENLNEIMQDWLDSRPHRRNLLSRRAAEFGLARVGDNYWVMVLGQRCKSKGLIIRF